MDTRDLQAIGRPGRLRVIMRTRIDDVFDEFPLEIPREVLFALKHRLEEMLDDVITVVRTDVRTEVRTEFCRECYQQGIETGTGLRMTAAKKLMGKRIIRDTLESAAQAVEGHVCISICGDDLRDCRFGMAHQIRQLEGILK